MQTPLDPLTFQPNIFDKFMLAAAELVAPLWMPLIVGSLFAILAKKLVPLAPISEIAKNWVLRIAGWVRNAAIYLVLFMFVVLFWYLWYASREYKFYQNL